VVAVAIVALALAALAPALSYSTMTLANARGESRAVALASARLEQLNALSYELGRETLLPVTDEVTDLSQVPATTTGTGIRPGDPSHIWRDAPGFVDWTAAEGQTVASTSGRARFVRRWAIGSLPGPVGSERLLVQVFAREWAREHRDAGRHGPAPRPGDVWLFTARGRVLR
jgi:hypothetical protein